MTLNYDDFTCRADLLALNTIQRMTILSGSQGETMITDGTFVKRGHERPTTIDRVLCKLEGSKHKMNAFEDAIYRAVKRKAEAVTT